MIRDIKEDKKYLNDLISLYKQVEWEHYISDLKKFEEMIENSSYCYGFFMDDNLIGTIRGMSDFISINYIQDIIISPDFQNRGLGAKLVEHILSEFSKVRTHTLITDNEEGQIAFYKKCSFQNTKDLKQDKLNCFVKFKDMILD